MALSKLLVCAFSLALLSYGQPGPETPSPSDLLCTCNKIVEAISGASQVFFPRERDILLVIH
jgi:hypothetical protein